MFIDIIEQRFVLIDTTTLKYVWCKNNELIKIAILLITNTLLFIHICIKI